jgi:hypothetical protein
MRLPENCQDFLYAWLPADAPVLSVATALPQRQSGSPVLSPGKQVRFGI